MAPWILATDPLEICGPPVKSPALEGEGPGGETMLPPLGSGPAARWDEGPAGSLHLAQRSVCEDRAGGRAREESERWGLVVLVPKEANYGLLCTNSRELLENHFLFVLNVESDSPSTRTAPQGSPLCSSGTPSLGSSGFRTQCDPFNPKGVRAVTYSQGSGETLTQVGSNVSHSLVKKTILAFYFPD